ncbi:LOW QUALITY PROTEIN: hypothetical protein PHMEG_00013002 [Phytophthora megakarya]|uniref:Uncharacterized protein n=1 Tax=Phytophthora megakarya TaxID=4795 RepID=A0A225W8W6_9STRA|nr:LOW QUALITY PROTEIN: hypothetical protein PHMEG_00013002 [Phytophthora megakarya]
MTFRVAEKIGEYAVKLEIPDPHTISSPWPTCQSSSQFLDRPVIRLTTQDQDRLDFDEALPPGNSWIQDRDPDEYEVEKISGMSTGRRTRYGRILREFWIDVLDLNCGAIHHEFWRDRANQNRFGVMQSHEEA